MTAPLVLDVFSDVVCPWCFIGKRRLFQALEGGPEVTLRWRAYQLAPDVPPEGLDALPYFERKFGGRERVRQAWERVQGIGAGVGIAFDFEGQTRAPNTRLAHEAVRFADRTGHGTLAQEALFSGHFEQREDIGRVETIVALFERRAVPVDLEALRAALLDHTETDGVTEDLRIGRELGVSGVPLFVANLDGLDEGRAVALSGAQEVPVFQRFLAEAVRRRNPESSRAASA